MEAFVDILRCDFPDFTFTPGNACYWSSRTKQIFYIANKDISSIDSLLHELGHALLRHEQFKTDVELIHKEVAAWEKAKELAIRYNLTLDENHAQDCLGSYRDWLHKRSTCPTCGSHGVQASRSTYSCLNCLKDWNVSSARLKRVYRRQASAGHVSLI